MRFPSRRGRSQDRESRGPESPGRGFHQATSEFLLPRTNRIGPLHVVHLGEDITQFFGMLAAPAASLHPRSLWDIEGRLAEDAIYAGQPWSTQRRQIDADSRGRHLPIQFIHI